MFGYGISNINHSPYEELELDEADFDDMDLDFAGVGFESELMDDWPEEEIDDTPFQFPVTTYCGSIRNFAI